MVPERIRNVVLVGHGGAGKTSLAEALLNVAGATTRVGRVEDGTTVTDFEPEETERQISLNVAVASCEWKGHKINILDSPGYADFIGDAVAALRVADMAIFVVSGVDGIEVQTEALWRAAAEENLPRVVFINKLDRERFQSVSNRISAESCESCPVGPSATTVDPLPSRSISQKTWSNSSPTPTPRSSRLSLRPTMK